MSCFCCCCQYFLYKSEKHLLLLSGAMLLLGPSIYYATKDENCYGKLICGQFFLSFIIIIIRMQIIPYAHTKCSSAMVADPVTPIERKVILIFSKKNEMMTNSVYDFTVGRMYHVKVTKKKEQMQCLKPRGL